MKTRIIAAALPFFLLLAACGIQETQVQHDFFAMDTIMSVQLDGSDAEQAAAETERRIMEKEKLWSRVVQDSDIGRLNAAEGAWVTVAPETAALLKEALTVAAQTDGAYDPTVAPLTDLWGIGTAHARVPAQDEIDKALSCVGYQNVEILENRVRLHNGAQLDLGGIAKGAAGSVALPEDTGGISSALLSLGGNIVAFSGTGQRESRVYHIGVADPDTAGDYIATIDISNACAVTTGDYERFFIQDGVRYHHVFDARTGYPAETDLRSATVITPYADGARADGLSTALFVMGLTRAQAYCEEHGIAAVLLTKDKRVMRSSEADRLYEVTVTGTDKGYTDA